MTDDDPPRIVFSLQQDGVEIIVTASIGENLRHITDAYRTFLLAVGFQPGSIEEVLGHE